MKLVGTAALVTGGSRGIGYAEADYLMAHGADVVITSRTADAVTASAAALTKVHPRRRAIGIAADASKAEDVRRAYDIAEAEIGPIAIVVNNAGNSTLDTVTRLPEEDWDAVVDTHMKGTFLSTKEAIARMRAAGITGVVINTGSVETFGTTRGNAHYAAAKAGIEKFTQVAALEAGPYGIRVNTVSPGAVATSIGEGVVTADFQAAWHRSFAIDRMGQPADIAKAVVFLASDYASWITGVNLLVDGGSALRGLPDYVHHLLPDQE
jgi:3-oxoacyl-[acyl-carrier protein] reductase